MALKTKSKRIQSAPGQRARKAKFQADLAPAEDHAMRVLKEELQLTGNTDFLSDALALFVGAEAGTPDSQRKREWRTSGAHVPSFGTGSPGRCPTAHRDPVDGARTGESCAARIRTESGPAHRGPDSGHAGLNGPCHSPP
jgi:hypothetical protein